MGRGSRDARSRAAPPERGIPETRLAKSARAQQAAVAAAARRAVRRRVVATVGQTVIEAERDAACDDRRLRQLQQRSEDAERSSFDAGARRERRDPLERPQVLGTAV